MYFSITQRIKTYQLVIFKWLITLLSVMLMSSCTSVVTLGVAYDSAASRFSKTLIGYADFTGAQKHEIRQRVAAYHQWHRQHQLPQYRLLIDEITRALTSPQKVTRSDLSEWIDTARGFSHRLSHCSPLNGSGRFLSTLSDRQVRQIAQKIKDRQSERVLEYQSITVSQRLEVRQRKIEKWARRAGVTMNSDQKAALRSTLSTQVSLSPQRHRLWQQWSDQLITLMSARGQSGFDSTLNQHVQSLWNITEKAYPNEWQANIELWHDFMFRFFQLMTPEQAQPLSGKLSRISKALGALQKKPGKATAQCFDIDR